MNRRTRLVLGLLLFATAVAAYLQFGPHIMDDAYITYRYASHAAAGHGPVYNVGENVFGYSNPLFMMTLALLGKIGVPIPAAGIVISALCGALTLALLIRSAAAMGLEPAGWFAAFLLSVQHNWVVILVSGMESTLYSALVVAMFLAVGTGRWRYLGLLSALVCLVRYDGVLACVAAFGVCAWRAGLKIAFKQGLVSLAMFAPWLLFAWAFHGTPIPQTITAKSFVYVLTFAETFTFFQLSFTPYMAVWPLWIVLIVWGTIVVARKPGAWVVFPLWAWGFVAFYFLKRVPVYIFPWYLHGAIAVLIWTGCIGLHDLAMRLPKWRFPAFALAAALLFFFQLLSLQRRSVPEYGIGLKSRESYYQDLAEALRPMMKPGESILTGEVGSLGWHLPDARVIDGVGLLSREALAIRKRDREQLRADGRLPNDWASLAIGSPAVKVWMLEELQPDYFTARIHHIPWEGLQNHPYLTEHYERLRGPEFDAYDMVLFRRIKK